MAEVEDTICNLRVLRGQRLVQNLLLSFIGPVLRTWNGMSNGFLYIGVQAGSFQNLRWEKSRYAFKTTLHEIPRRGDLGSYLTITQKDDELETDFNCVAVLNPLCNNRWLKTIVQNSHPYFATERFPADNEGDSRPCIVEMLFYGSVLYYIDGRELLVTATSTRQFFCEAFDRAWPSYGHFTHVLKSIHKDDWIEAFPLLQCDVQDLSQICRGLIDANAQAVGTDSMVRFVYVKTDQVDINPREKTLLPEGDQNASDIADTMFQEAIEFTQTHRDVLMVVVFPFDVASIFLFRSGALMRLDEDSLHPLLDKMCELRNGLRFHDLQVGGIFEFCGGRPKFRYGVVAAGEHEDNEVELIGSNELME